MNIPQHVVEKQMAKIIKLCDKPHGCRVSVLASAIHGKGTPSTFIVRRLYLMKQAGYIEQHSEKYYATPAGREFEPRTESQILRDRARRNRERIAESHRRKQEQKRKKEDKTPKDSPQLIRMKAYAVMFKKVYNTGDLTHAPVGRFEQKVAKILKLEAGLSR